MKRKWIILALFGWAMSGTAWAGYTIDGSLSDWGVTPFTDWAPNPPASYTETNNQNFYSAWSYAEPYDFEAMYFDNDASYFYLAVVRSYLGTELDPLGDLGLDLNGDMAISEHGVTTGLEYAVHVRSGTPGQVVRDPVWDDTNAHEEWDGWQGSPYRAIGGTVVGSADIALTYDPTLDGATCILEAAIPRNIFPDNGGDIGDPFGAHLTIWCGNDSINHIGTISVIPAPGAIVLSGLGIGLVGWLRRRRTLV